MATEKQIAANRINAKRSTGPKSARGKARSSRNGLFTGLLARDFIVTAIENPADFEALLASLTAEFRPESAHEQLLVCQLARQVWMARRAARVEAAVTAHALDAAGRDLWGDQPPPADPGLAAALDAHCLGVAWARDASGAIARAQHHFSVLDRNIARTLRLLKRPKAAAAVQELRHAAL
ncbi:MAG: hypothetical protein IPM24_04610 [Bryobacterales bacterium]|nr:hypothetical protein [Bryobacterales bacterium]